MWSRSFAVLALVLAVGSVAAAQEQAQPTVSSLGEAVVRRPPDRVIITFGTETRGQSPQEAQARGTAAMKAVQEAIERLKLPGIQAMTTGMNLSEDYDYVNSQRVSRGYIDRHSVVVSLDEVGRAGEVMTVATAAGATDIRGLRFDRRDREALEEEALKLAVGVARARADALAAGAGRTVDRVLKIAEARAATVASLDVTKYVVPESVTVGDPVPVASGEIEIRMRVLLTATIK